MLVSCNGNTINNAKRHFSGNDSCIITRWALTEISYTIVITRSTWNIAAIGTGQITEILIKIALKSLFTLMDKHFRRIHLVQYID